MTRARPERTGLDRFVGMDLRNFRTSRRLLRDNDLYDLPQRVTGVYTATRESVQHATTQRKTDDDVFFAVLFLLRSAYAFEKGIVEVMRLHLGDSYGYLRSAIEAAGFADLVRRDRTLARTWMDAAGDEARYRLYKQRFRTGELFPKDDPLMRKLRTMYNWSSRMASHGSVYAFSTRLDVVRDGTTVQFNYRYQDVRPDETPREVLFTFLVHINTHLGVLQVFGRALKDVIERTDWDRHFTPVENLFERHRDRLAPVLDPRRQPRAGRLVLPVRSLIVPVRPTMWTPGPPRRRNG